MIVQYVKLKCIKDGPCFEVKDKEFCLLYVFYEIFRFVSVGFLFKQEVKEKIPPKKDIRNIGMGILGTFMG